MKVGNIEFSQDELQSICRRHGVRRLALFGSVLRDDFGPDSDIDVLIEFEPGMHVGFRLFRVEEELSALFGEHKVDLVNPKYLNRFIRDKVLSEAQVIHAA
jgi:predicted nucleotidyltransferase